MLAILCYKYYDGVSTDYSTCTINGDFNIKDGHNIGVHTSDHNNERANI